MQGQVEDPLSRIKVISSTKSESAAARKVYDH